jgi:hypothetical protein
VDEFQPDNDFKRIDMIRETNYGALAASLSAEMEQNIRIREIRAIDEIVNSKSNLNAPLSKFESAVSSKESALSKLEETRKEHKGLLKRYDDIRNDCITKDCSLPGGIGDLYRDRKSELNDKTDVLKEQTEVLRVAIETEKKARTAYRNAKDAIKDVSLPPKPLFNVEERLAELQNRTASVPSEVMQSVEEEGVPAALKAGALLVAIWFGVRTLLFFVLAPWLERRPPFRLEPSLRPLSLPSQFSPGREIEVRLSDDEELVIRPDHVELEPGDTVVGHVSVLSRRSWFRSLTRGLHSFERITAKEGSVAVQSKSHQSSVVEITLESGSALALNPDNLVGLVRAKNVSALQMGFPFRPFRAFSWATGQFRHFYVCGPARVILKGGGDLKLEPPAGRLMPWPAVVAFDASTKLRARRPQSFWSYLWGFRSLAQVTTEGAEGFVIRQQMSSSDDLRRPGPERAFGGTVDAAMKPFG